jgi:hypothetical protein
VKCLIQDEQTFVKLIEDTKEVQKLDYEIMDLYRSQLVWLIQYCKRYSVPLPNMEVVLVLIKQAGVALEKRDSIIAEMLDQNEETTHPATPKDNTQQGNTTKKLVITSFLVMY